MLGETLSILKRFAELPGLPTEDKPALTEGLYHSLVILLGTHEALVLQCVLVAMYHLVQIEQHMLGIGAWNGCAETLLRILADYDPQFKKLSAELLELLLHSAPFFNEVVDLREPLHRQRRAGFEVCWEPAARACCCGR